MRADPLQPLKVEELSPGFELGHYQIVDKISQGGMGIVFRAHEPTLNREVALKVLASKYAADINYVKSFQEEAQLVASLRHPHIIPIYFIGQIGQVVFYSMAYISNPSLDSWINEGRRFDLKEVKWFLTQACSALECATEAGLIHLDIKPSNFLVDDGGSLFLTDFGLAKLMGGSKGVIDEELYGTPSYVAPERVLRKPLDHRTDIYSLGATLFHLIVGEPPYDSESLQEIVDMHLRKPFPEEKAVEKGVPQPLIDLMRKMMEKDPVRRFQSYAEILNVVHGLDYFHYKPIVPLSIKEMEYAVPNQYADIQRFEGLLWVAEKKGKEWNTWIDADPNHRWQSDLGALTEMMQSLGETLNLGPMQGFALQGSDVQALGCQKNKKSFVMIAQVAGGDLSETQAELRGILERGDS